MAQTCLLHSAHTAERETSCSQCEDGDKVKGDTAYIRLKLCRQITKHRVTLFQLKIEVEFSGILTLYHYVSFDVQQQ